MHKHSSKLFLLAFILVLLLFCGDISYLDHENLSSFMMQNWCVTYSSGFVFRGLCGTLLAWIQKPITSLLVMQVNIIIVVLYTAFVYMYALAFYKKQTDDYGLLLLLFMLVQPPVLQRWITSATIGRLDTVMALVFMITIAVVKAKNNYLKYIGAFLLSVFAMLCHEGYAILFIPTLFGIMLFFAEKKWQPLCYYLAPLFIVWLFITINGQADIPVNEFLSMLSNHAINTHGGHFDTDTIEIVYYMNISQKINMTLNYYTKQILFKVIMTFIILSPTIYVLLCNWAGLIRQSSGKKRASILLLCLLTLSPLGALLFGVDTYRWIAWALFNNLAALCILYVFDEPSRERMVQVTIERKYAVIFAILCALAFGVFTVFSSYDFVEYTLPRIYSMLFGR